MSKPTTEQLEAFIDELIDHLDYCGWGDSWEREVSEKLQEKAVKWQNERTLDE